MRQFIPDRPGRREVLTQEGLSTFARKFSVKKLILVMSEQSTYKKPVSGTLTVCV